MAAAVSVIDGLAAAITGTKSHVVSTCNRFRWLLLSMKGLVDMGGWLP